MASLPAVQVNREFEYEISAGKIEPLKVENGFSILALVGDNMKSHTGVSGKMFTTLGQNGINIHAIAQGSTERNISADHLDEGRSKSGQHASRRVLLGRQTQVNVFIAGCRNRRQPPDRTASVAARAAFRGHAVESAGRRDRE